MAEKLSFHWADYLVFAMSLVMSLAIGVYFGIKGRKNLTSEEFLLGGRNINILPVAFSIMASTLNGVYIIGAPAEVYYYGPVYMLLSPSATAILLVVVCWIFIPVFHRMKLTSVYEYFDRRYDFPPLRVAVSLLFIMNMLMFLGVVLYAPALAISEVSGLSLVASILTSGAVCTIYTAIGGMKAVVWTDTFQSVVIASGMAVLVIMGVRHESLGGLGEVFERVKRGNRLDFGVWDIDPRARHTVWTQVIGHGVIWTSVYASNQMMVQRFLSVSTVRDARLALIGSTVASFVISVFVILLSWVTYAYYFNCDPVQSGTISKGDQIVPRFLMEIIGHFHGLPGLFTAAVFAAALSSVSSALNSLSAVILEDFCKPIYKLTKTRDMPVRTAATTSKVIAVFFGLLTVAMSFSAEYMGDNLASMPGTVWGAVCAPIFGVFLISMMVPWATGLGCLVGLLTSILLTLWMTIGGAFHRSPRSVLQPLGMCNDVNATMSMSTPVQTASIVEQISPTLAPESYGGALQYFYDISYAWYGVIGVVTCVAVGLLASLLHNLLGNTGIRERTGLVDPSHLFSCVDLCCCYCPLGCKDMMRCGVHYPEEGMPENHKMMAQGDGPSELTSL